MAKVSKMPVNAPECPETDDLPAEAPSAREQELLAANANLVALLEQVCANLDGIRVAVLGSLKRV